MKKLIHEFQEFAIKGNVMNLAVGVLIGAAFQGVVTSLTDNLLSPLIGLFTGQNFDNLQLEFWGITLRYGAFLTSLVNFFMVALVVFLLVKGMARLPAFQPKAAPKPETTTRECPYCRSSIALLATRCPHCTSHLKPD